MDNWQALLKKYPAGYNPGWQIDSLTSDEIIEYMLKDPRRFLINYVGMSADRFYWVLLDVLQPYFKDKENAPILSNNGVLMDRNEVIKNLEKYFKVI